MCSHEAGHTSELLVHIVENPALSVYWTEVCRTKVVRKRHHTLRVPRMPAVTGRATVVAGRIA